MPVPIIGQQPSRGWLRIGVKMIHDNQARPGPGGVLHIPTQHWRVAIAGLRSDGLKITRVADLSPEQAKDPAKIAVALESLSRDLESFLNCLCTPTQACRPHATDTVSMQAPPGRPM